MHSVMNGIVSSDGEYQAILRKSDIYSGELDRMDLSKEIRLLIDRYVSEQNAHSTCAIDPGIGCSPTCWDLFFQLFLYDFLIPQNFRPLHPRNAAAQPPHMADEVHSAAVCLL
jgi:hypothetical protein